MANVSKTFIIHGPSQNIANCAFCKPKPFLQFSFIIEMALKHFVE